MIIARPFFIIWDQHLAPLLLPAVLFHLEPFLILKPTKYNLLILLVELRYLTVVCFLDHDSYSDDSSPAICGAII